MARARKTILCDDCGAEFEVIVDSYDVVHYCCFCGAELDQEEEIDEDYE